MNRAQLLLTFNYLVVTICLTGTIFALCEGVLGIHLQRKSRELRFWPDAPVALATTHPIAAKDTDYLIPERSGAR